MSFFHSNTIIKTGAFIGMFVLSANSLCVAASKSIADLYWGELVFQFKQDNYYQAISQLLKAESSGYIDNNATDKALLSHELYRSYGMLNKAGQVLKSQQGKASEEGALAEAQILLATSLFQRGRYQQALTTLPANSVNLSEGSAQQYRDLKIRSLLMLGRVDEVANMHSELAEASYGWNEYSRFNLAMALFNTGRIEDARTILKDLTELQTGTELHKNMRDKANYEMALSYIEENRLWEAKGYLQQIHLRGLTANKALLASGWVNSQLGNDEVALKLWQGMQGRAIEDLAVQESFLASPYVLSSLQANTDALRGYDNAVALFSTEIFRIDQALQGLNGGEFTREILRTVELEGEGRLWDFSGLARYPEHAYIKDIVDHDEFRELLKDYRDIRLVIRKLDLREAELDVFKENLQGRQAYLSNDWQSKIERGYDRATINEIKTQRNALAKQVKKIESSNDENAMMSSDEKRQLAALDNLATMIDAITDTARADAIKLRHKRLKSIILWNSTVNYAERMIELKQGMRELNGVVQSLERQAASLDHNWKSLPNEIASREKRIQQKREELKRAKIEAAAVLQGLEDVIQTFVINTLLERKEILHDYRTQARYALAQLYDRAQSGELMK